MQRSDSHRIILLTFLIVLFFTPVNSEARYLYSKKELLAAGQMWIETNIQWNMDLQSHDRRMKKINDSSMPEPKKDTLRKREISRHTDRSNMLAAKRDQVQNLLVEEANARAKSGKTDASTSLKESAGTKLGEAGHRGMKGDKDLGGGSRTTKKVKEVLADMGLYNPDPKLNKKNPFGLTVVETPGTLEIQGEFDLTINKDGIKPKVGSEFHQVKIDVDAANPETYVSESLKTRDAAGEVISKKVGADYVEIQDHRKKASKGLTASSDTLAKQPKKMQGLAKGTFKTLDMKVVDEETLGKILQQNGIKDTPAQFKQKLQDIKEGKLTISNSDETLKIKNTSRDVFNASESKVFSQTKQDIVDLRAKAAQLSPNDPKYIAIQEEIVDSVTKMKSTKKINDRIFSTESPSKKPIATKTQVAPDIESSGARRKITPQTVDVELKSLGVSKFQAAKETGGKVFGAVMNIVDIGQSCQAVEDYVEGKKPLSEVALTIVDQYVTQGAIGATTQMYHTTDDYLAARESIATANRNNMTAYLTNWEIQFRNAGMTREEARKYIGNAMLSGNLDILEKKARSLQAEGQKIKQPVLVTDTFEGDDTLVERAKNIGYGVVKGADESLTYIATTHERVANALGEREIKEAELAARGDTITAQAKQDIFKRLVSDEIPSQEVLVALNEWQGGNNAPIRALFKKVKALEEAKKPTPEEMVAIKAEEERLAQEEQIRSALLKKYALYLNYLRVSELTLTSAPETVVLEREGEPVPMTLSLTDKYEQYQKVVIELKKTIEALTGQPGKVNLTYKFSSLGKVATSPHVWLAESPPIEGVYPVSCLVTVDVGGSGVTGNMELLKTRVERDITVFLTVEPPGFDYSTGIWPELRKTNRVTVNMGLYHNGNIGASGSVSFQDEEHVQGENFVTDVTILISSDGEYIKELVVSTDAIANGETYDRWRYIFNNLVLKSLTKESETSSAYASYGVENSSTYEGVYQQAVRQEGSFIWKQGVPAGDIRYNKSIKSHVPVITVSFSVDEKAQQAKQENASELRKKKEKDKQAIVEASKTGVQYVGPFGEKEGMAGEIIVFVSEGGKTVSGTFKAEKLRGDSKKGIVEGAFTGAMDPESGRLEASLTGGNMFTMVKQEGKWHMPPGSMRGMSKDTMVLGELLEDTLSGYFLLKEKKGFNWAAIKKEQ
ncbi:MAG: hypothetical protein GY799_26795 [Desulfobulbaceae bacterium]|nr:hypothetical protein [Desulfobulbaceae bacterium]